MNPMASKKILIIQTAFIGDTILASHFARSVKNQYPDHEVHFLLRKGNESVISGLASVDKVWVWDKAQGKFLQLIKIIRQLRLMKFDFIFNLHRHFNSGLVTFLVKSKVKVGFRQNPFSWSYTHRVAHQIPFYPDGKKDSFGHEIDRNLTLLSSAETSFQPNCSRRPELPLKEAHHDKISAFIQKPFFVLAPASVWFTKAWSELKYQELTKELIQYGTVYFIGAPSDFELCERIRSNMGGTINLCGKLSLLESAALMASAKRVFVNDSAPLHLASCVNAKTTAIFCSTLPSFGYTPLSDEHKVIEIQENLSCRPCGLHGHTSCPQGHFKCSQDIDVNRVLQTIF
jgi:lipopolysaccharide heptosyltransferase II